MPGEPAKQFGQTNYLGIADGKFRQKATKDTLGAVQRKDRKTGQPVKDKDGNDIYDVFHKNWEGVIRKANVVETKFGKRLNIVFDDATIACGINSDYFRSFAQRFANIDLSQTVKLVPYDFTDKGKIKKGISVQQNGEKLDSYYYKDDKFSDRIPQPPKDNEKMEKKDWTRFFEDLSDFYANDVKWLEGESVADIAEEFDAVEVKESPADEKQKAIDPEDLPF